MAISINDLKAELQGFFTDGLAVIVGSGLSVAEGIPGMGALEAHLDKTIPPLVSGQDLKCWQEIAVNLAAKKGLEAALLATKATEPLEEKIIAVTVALIECAEKKVIAEVIEGKRELPLSLLLPHLNPQPNRALPVITTNYDRLVEIAAETIGWGVDCMFVGHCVGTLDSAMATRSFIKDFKIARKGLAISYRNRICIAKPHGSLDWFRHTKGPLRTSIPVDLPRLVITPGGSKYQKGYSIPFDRHRENGNTAIDAAARLLVLGYGFNDDHLETHLSQNLRQGKPCLILTHQVTENGMKALAESPNAIALSHDPKNSNGVICTRGKTQTSYDGGSIWSVKSFVEKVLTP